MLTLPSKFKQALGNGTRTSLYPLVRIYKGYQIDDTIPDNAEAINLSIKETTIKNLDTENDTYESYIPLLLNSPSISSKADIINNKYTISSVSLSISNALYNGKIFSDDIPSLLNAVVQVYYAANGLETLDDCLLVYTGTIRRYSQSAETLNLTLEDLTEQKLKTQIPSTLIDDDDSYADEQLGQPYPMVYGYVDKSPVILDKFDSLAIDKPDIEIKGIWEKVSKIDLLNPYLTEYNYLIQTGWLKEESSLYTYNDGYLPIMKQMPIKFGSRQYDLGENNMYEFENTTSGTSAKINLDATNFIYERYVENPDDEDEIVGEGNLGIPTRIYRPVVKVSFFAKNRKSIAEDDPPYTFVGASNKFYGFNNTFNYEMAKNVKRNNFFQDDGGGGYDESYNNIASNADALYEEGWELGNWWQPTDLNNASGTDDGDGTFADKDFNYIDNQNFPVKWIQNTSDYSGLVIDSQVRQDYDGGSYARLELNTDVPDYPCVTKIFYKIDYFTPTNIDTQSDDNIEGEPTAFWVERNLIERKRNDSDSFGDMVIQNKWDDNRDTEDWITWCEVPNKHHEFYTDNNQFRYTNTFLGGLEFDNINLGFGSTNAYDSIQWGLPQMIGVYYKVSSCIANLKQFYTVQDVLVPEYTKESFYANVKGRIDDDENVISKPHTILQDILEKELGYGKEIILPDEDIQDDWINSFSMNEQSEAKSIIESLFKSSIYIPSFNSNGDFKFIDLKQNIEDYEQFEVIDNLDIIKYSFGLTKLEDVKNQINVKYKKDYGAGDFAEETTYAIEDNNGNSENTETLDKLMEKLDIDDMVYDIAYYGMKDKDAKLEVESEYIRDKDTARKLQRRLLMWYANQHLTMKLDLPPSYMHLEAGDYLRFDELIGDKLAFGFDYTQEFVKNGQLIYPVFFVTKVAKSLSKVSLELVQVHRGDFGMSDNDLGNYKIPNPYRGELYEPVEEEDFPELFTASWDTENPDLQQGQITAIVNTNQEGSISYEIFLLESSHTFDVDVLESNVDYGIAQGTYYENPLPQAEVLVADYLSITESEFGDNVDIGPYINRFNIIKNNNTEENIDNENIELKFGIRIISEADESLQSELVFSHTILPMQYDFGDVNRDNNLNVQDVIMLVQYILGLQEFDEEQQFLADFTQDGVINILDVVNMVEEILGN